MILVTHEVAMELEDHHVLDCTDSRAEVAIKYQITLTDTRHEIVSLLMLMKCDDDWRIQRECVQSIRSQSLGCSGGCSGGGGGGAICIGGQCPLR